MRREAATPRPGWQQKLEQLGFDYYVLEGKAYWTEQACYAFTSDEIDELEAATEKLQAVIPLLTSTGNGRDLAAVCSICKTISS